MDIGTKNFLNYLLDTKDIQRAARGKICEIGSLDANGQCKNMFNDCESYLGVDIQPGKNVDLVGHFCDVDLNNQTFDLVLSLNCLEHDPRWRETLQKSLSCLNDNGCLIIFVPSEMRLRSIWYLPFKKTDRSKRCLNDWKTHAKKENQHVAFNCKWVEVENGKIVEEKKINYISEDLSQPINKHDIDLVLPYTSFTGNINSTHLVKKHNYFISHNVHYTKEGEYYSSLPMGKILEIIFSVENFKDYEIIHREISTDSGLQLGLVVRRKQTKLNKEQTLNE